MNILGYLDAGTGSVIAGMIAAVGTGFVVAFKRIRYMFTPKRRDAAPEDATQSN